MDDKIGKNLSPYSDLLSYYPSSGLNGWILLDKPSGITSAHAVAKVKRLLKPSKIGHAGTLDPLASGILPLALGEATKTVAYMMGAAKAYSFTVTWGQERDTDDIEGNVTQTSDRRPTVEEVQAILPEFTGAIQQMPPNYSALKVDGKRAYELARQGQEAGLKAREVRVDSLIIAPAKTRVQFINNTAPDGALLDSRLRGNDKSMDFICHCGKGTYIRSLARDMGRKLGCLGHISVLRRLKVGQFDESHAISLENLEKMVHKGDLSFLRPVDAALDDIPAWNVSSDQAVLLRQGRSLLLPELKEEPDGKILLLRSEGKPLAMAQVSQGSVKPVRVFNL